MTLHLTETSVGELLAESRLVGFFAEARFLGRTIDLRVADSIPLSYFTESVLGVTLAMSADTIVSESGRRIFEDARAHLRRSLAKDNGVAGSDSQFILPVLDNLVDDGAFAQFPLLGTPSSLTFPLGLERLLRSLFRNQYTGDLSFVAQFLFEMWHNTIDHALDDLLGKRIDGFRCIIAKIRPIATAGLGAGGIEAEYVAAVSERFGPALYGLLEISVCDSGVGIGARISGNPNFRELKQSEQFHYIQRAIVAGESSKKRRGSGLGYTKALRVIDKLRGLLLLKTGELSAGKDYLAPHEPWPSELLYSMLTHSKGVVRGTAVSLVLPVTRKD